MSTEMKRNYKVFVDVLTTHEYEVEEVNSPEEAESIVEQWLEEGEEGVVAQREVTDMTSFRSDEGENN